jgi:6-phosphofructokinase 1
MGCKTMSGDYVTNQFLNYIRPFIQAELTPIMANGLSRHLYNKEN